MGPDLHRFLLDNKYEVPEVISQYSATTDIAEDD